MKIDKVAFRQSTLEELIENELNERNMSEEVNLPTQAGPDFTTSTTTTQTTTMSREELGIPVPAPQEIRRPGIIDINLNDIHEKVKLGYSRLAKDDVGFGSIQQEYGLTFSEVKELFENPVLKGIRRGRSRVRIATTGGLTTNRRFAGGAAYLDGPEVLNDTPEFARFVEENTSPPSSLAEDSNTVPRGIWMTLSEHENLERFRNHLLRSREDSRNEALAEIERIQMEEMSNRALNNPIEIPNPATRDIVEEMRQSRIEQAPPVITHPNEQDPHNIDLLTPTPQPTLDPEIARLDEIARRLMGNIQSSPVNRPMPEEPRAVDPDNGDFREDDDDDESYEDEDEEDFPFASTNERHPVLQAAIDNYNERRRVGQTVRPSLRDIGYPPPVPNDPAEAYRAGRQAGESILSALAELKKSIDEKEAQKAQNAEIERLKEESKKNPSLIQVIQGVAAGAAEREKNKGKKEILKSIFS